MTRILIADDQALVRGGFRLILEEQPDLEVVGEAADGDEAVALTRKVRPDVVLMDIRMPRRDGLAAVREIFATRMECRVIMLTTFDIDEYVFQALQAGASGFLLKDVSPPQLVASIRLVAAGEALLAPSITRRLIERFARESRIGPPPALETLTARETEVLRELARGLTNAEIAEALHLSGDTIKTHVARVLSKLGLRSRVQAVVMAYESRLVQPGG